MRLLLAVIAATALPASAQALKQVRDWVGACDNTRHCTVIGMAPDSADRYAMLHFERGGAGMDRVAKVTMRVDAPVSRLGHWRVVDEQQQTLLTLSDLNLVDADSGEGIDVVFESPQDIDVLLGALRTTHALTLVGDGGPVGVVSLSGASAVLLWIDEQQRRLGTTTAFVRRGAAAPATIPVAPPAPRAPLKSTVGVALGIEDATPAGTEVRKTLSEEDCESPDPALASADQAWTLSDGRTLVQLLCFSGAYNFGSRLYLLDAEGVPQLLSVPVPQEDGTLAREVDLINAHFDTNRGRLHSFNKGRGIGDCGSVGEWAWTAEGFRLVRYSSFPDCRGVMPDFWPVRWQSGD
ncbi:MAG: DUF1176 domain-containing protein [Xanthomonadales bacterium]|jgi:hypothetical protein|nr:DUF1176 domain-containing protein [Xanthomonadales bacterium]